MGSGGHYYKRVYSKVILEKFTAQSKKVKEDVGGLLVVVVWPVDWCNLYTEGNSILQWWWSMNDED